VADCRSREREERQRLRVAGGPAGGPGRIGDVEGAVDIGRDDARE
jgi:hypothetical protein